MYIKKKPPAATHQFPTRVAQNTNTKHVQTHSQMQSHTNVGLKRTLEREREPTQNTTDRTQPSGRSSSQLVTQSLLQAPPSPPFVLLHLSRSDVITL